MTKRTPNGIENIDKLLKSTRHGNIFPVVLVGDATVERFG